MEYVLQHHGVKGQKWGVRRREKRIAKAVKSGDLNYIKKHPERFSNEQIKEAAKRRKLIDKQLNKPSLETISKNAKTNSQQPERNADKGKNQQNQQNQKQKQKQKQPKTVDQKLQTAQNVMNTVSTAVRTYQTVAPVIEKLRNRKTEQLYADFKAEEAAAVRRLDSEWLMQNFQSVSTQAIKDFTKRKNAAKSAGFGPS